MTVAKFDAIYQKSRNIADKVVYSDLYVAATCLWVFLAWSLNWSVAGLAVLVAIAAVSLFFVSDLSALFPAILFALLPLREISDSQLISLWPLLILIAAGGGVFLWKNHPQKVKLGSCFWGFVAVTVALFLGGLGNISAKDYASDLPLMLCLGPAIVGIYFVFINYSRAEKVDTALHFAKCCVYMGLVVGMELFSVIVQSNLEPSQWMESYWTLGWGNRNMVATALFFGVVLSFYLAVREKKFGFIYFVVGFVEMSFLLLTLSRGGILFGGIAFVVAVVMSILRGNRKQLLITLGATAAAILIVCAIFHNFVGKVIAGAWERFSQIHIYFDNGKLIIEGTSGRTGPGELYDVAWQLFKKYPIFGAGMGGHSNVAIHYSPAAQARFHSTILEILASMGLMGVLCYGFYYFLRFRKLFVNGNIKKNFPLFVLLCWVAFEGQSLVDMNTFEPVFVIYVTLQLVIMESRTQPETPVGVVWLWNTPWQESFPAPIKALVQNLSYTCDQTGRSKDVVYLFEDKYLLKVSANREKLLREKAATDWLADKTVGAKSVAWAEDGLCYYLRTQIAGESLISPRFLQNPELLVDIAVQAVEVLKGLDDAHCPFDCIGSSGNQFVHGDLCLPNILVDSQNNFAGFVDLSDSGLGDRWQDYAWLLWSLQYNLQTDKYNQLLLQKLGVEFDNEKYLQFIPAESLAKLNPSNE